MCQLLVQFCRIHVRLLRREFGHPQEEEEQKRQRERCEGRPHAGKVGLPAQEGRVIENRQTENGDQEPIFSRESALGNRSTSDPSSQRSDPDANEKDVR